MYNYNVNEFKDKYKMKLESTYKLFIYTFRSELANQKQIEKTMPFLEPPA